MKTTALRCFFVLFSALCLLSGCSKNVRQASGENTKKTAGMYDNGESEKGTVVYTNLLGEEVQGKVREILLSSGIAAERIDKVFDWVRDFNQCMNDKDLYLQELADSFVKAESLAIDYGEYPPKSRKWYRDNNRNYSDVLCRIAAFQLLQDYIEVENLIDKEEWECYSEMQWLYSDRDAIEGYPIIDFSNEEQHKYFSVFNPVGIKKDCSEAEMYSDIAKEWEKRGIKFFDGKASLITIWVQAENQTAAAHAAVLAEYDEGLLLFEKINPQEPYQATKFSSIEQVRQHMYECIHIEDVRYGDETGKYVVMRNNELI